MPASPSIAAGRSAARPGVGQQAPGRHVPAQHCSSARLTATKLPTRAKLPSSRRTGSQSNACRNCSARSRSRLAGRARRTTPAADKPEPPSVRAADTRRSRQRSLRSSSTTVASAPRASGWPGHSRAGRHRARQPVPRLLRRRAARHHGRRRARPWRDRAGCRAVPASAPAGQPAIGQRLQDLQQQTEQHHRQHDQQQQRQPGRIPQARIGFGLTQPGQPGPSCCRRGRQSENLSTSSTSRITRKLIVPSFRQQVMEAARRRSQSKAGPDRVLRPGAMSLWPHTRSGVIAGYAHCSSRQSSISAWYCASLNGSWSVPSSSIPMEKSLQPSRPSKQDTPACQARSRQGTNWVMAPSRSMKNVRRPAARRSLRRKDARRTAGSSERTAEPCRYRTGLAAG